MPITAICNINKEKNICNVTRLILERVSVNVLYATNPTRNNEIVISPRIGLESYIDRVVCVCGKHANSLYI